MIPEQIERILKKVNSLDTQSSLLEVVEIYRDFIIAHPFHNYNGKTGRLLIEYCLLRAGIELKEGAVLPQNPLWKSAESAELLFRSLLAE